MNGYQTEPWYFTRMVPVIPVSTNAVWLVSSTQNEGNHTQGGRGGPPPGPTRSRRRTVLLGYELADTIVFASSIGFYFILFPAAFRNCFIPGEMPLHPCDHGQECPVAADP